MSLDFKIIEGYIDFVKSLTFEEKRIVALLLAGLERKEVENIIGLSQPDLTKRMYKIRRKFKEIFEIWKFLLTESV